MANIYDLLQKTSRTFALCIPLLPEPTRREVALSYLLFRIVDTFEDAAIWSKAQRIAALQEFDRLLEAPSQGIAQEMASRWMVAPPTLHEGYQELLKEAPFVMAEYGTLREEAREIIGFHVRRTAFQMAAFVERTDEEGTLRLLDLKDLRAYCYAVAGIVGEMLTALFVLGREELQGCEHYLLERAPLFGEGLQLTNIVKDAQEDKVEGRRFLPCSTDVEAVFALAYQDLDAAADYTLALQEAGAARGLIAFNALPLLLARATLQRVASQGPGAKLTRAEVFSIIQALNEDLDYERPVCPRTVPHHTPEKGELQALGQAASL